MAINESSGLTIELNGDLKTASKGAAIAPDNMGESCPILASKNEFESLKDKVVLISGGTTGIGRTTAIRLLLEGAKVMVFGRHEKELGDALADMNKIPDSVCIGVVADQSRSDDLLTVFKRLDSELGPLDILINNAAVAGDSVLDMGVDDIRYVVESNLIGPLMCTHMAMDRFSRASRGQIINIGSVSSSERGKGSDIYVATKAALNAFSESLAKMARDLGVRVSCIEPGSTGSDMSEATPQEQREKIANLRMLKAEDVAEAIVFILVQPKRCDISLLEIRPHLTDRG